MGQAHTGLLRHDTLVGSAEDRVMASLLQTASMGHRWECPAIEVRLVRCVVVHGTAILGKWLASTETCLMRLDEKSHVLLTMGFGWFLRDTMTLHSDFGEYCLLQVLKELRPLAWLLNTKAVTC